MFKYGDIVKVVTDRPDGCSEDIYLRGEIGVVKSIEIGYEDCYDVKFKHGSFVFTKDQLALASDIEVKDALRAVFLLNITY